MEDTFIFDLTGGLYLLLALLASKLVRVCPEFTDPIDSRWRVVIIRVFQGNCHELLDIGKTNEIGVPA